MRNCLFLTILISISSCSTRPGPSMLQEPSIPTPEIDMQGHRGARGLLPENTIQSFQRALELGVTTLEMDVVISKDHQVVVSHEPWFSGHICSLPSGDPVPLESEKDYKIYEMTYNEVRTFDCGIRGNARFPEQEKMPAHKPLLKDVIALAESFDRGSNAPILYNIETKSQPERDRLFHPPPDVFTQLLIEVIENANISERATIQSFDPRTLQVARATDPKLSLALLVDNEPDIRIQDHIDNLGFIPRIYSPHYQLVNPNLIAVAHDMNMLVIPWTINTLEEMQDLVALGVDGIITDYPDIGMQLLEMGSDRTKK